MKPIGNAEEALGSRILALMEQRGFARQVDLAEATGIKQSSISDLIAGVTTREKVRASTLMRLAAALDTTWEYLWSGNASQQAFAQQEAELVALWRSLDDPGKGAVVHYARGIQQAQQTAAAAHKTLALMAAEADHERQLAEFNPAKQRRGKDAIKRRS
jgi:transcriptional regulator with XRE-family HTH domain